MSVTRMQQNAEFIEREFSFFQGAKLLRIRQATEEELSQLMWDDHDPAIVMLFDNGRTLTVSCDPEGNEPGFLFEGVWS